MTRRIRGFGFAPALAILAWLVAGLTPVRAQVLTKAIEVRSLSVAEAQKGLPAKLRGTVIFVERSAIFLQDDTSTTFFRPSEINSVHPGDEIEVEGLTRMGLYLPGLGESAYRVLRSGVLPPGIPANYDDLVSARFHYQRVAIEGVVRSVAAIDEGRSLLRLAMGSRVLEVRVDMPPERDRSLVDCVVRIQGLAAGYHNERRQLVQAHLRVIDWMEVAVLDAAPRIDEAPKVSAAELLAFRVSGKGERRVRIEGVVTAPFPGGHVFFRQDETAFGVRLTTPTPLDPGDRVELIGFPEMDAFSASVVNADIVRREPGEPVPAIDVGSIDRLAGLHDGQLVAVTGTLADDFKTDTGSLLVLQDRTRVVQVRVPSAEAPLAELGSRVRVTGICFVETAQPGTGFASRPGVVSLRLRRAADLTVLQAPPWWTVRRLGTILAGLVAITLVAGLWIAILRRQVRRQTTALRHRIEAEAALEERQRIAREFHDTLEQELAGVTLRLDALATRVTDDKGQGLVMASRNLVSRIQTETRDLISDLRDPAETAGDLVAALTALASRATGEGSVDVRLDIATAIPTLPGAIVHDVRMIARESLNNAVKHGRAAQVSFQLEARDGQLTLRIIDNGCGFDATAATLSKRGHFGCAGIRERSRKIGAQVTWQRNREDTATTDPARATVKLHADPANSKARSGTTVQVVLPLKKITQKPIVTIPVGETVSATAVYPAKPIVL